VQAVDGERDEQGGQAGVRGEEDRLAEQDPAQRSVTGDVPETGERVADSLRDRVPAGADGGDDCR
jgi:hypothetical protein